MSDTPATTAPATTAPAPKAPVKVAPPVVTPMAFRLSVRPRESAKQAIADLKPDGNPKSELVAIAKEVVAKLIDLHPEEYQGVEIVCEVGGGQAHQINIVVIPHKW